MASQFHGLPRGPFTWVGDRMLLKWLVVPWAVLVFAPSPGRAAPIVFDSLTGSPSGPTTVPLGVVSHAVNLWFDPGEDFFDFSLSFMAQIGLDIDSFTPDPGINPTVQFIPGDGGTLVLIDSSSLVARSGALRIGELQVEGLAVGSALELVDLPDVIAPSFTNANFDVVFVPVPQLIATVVPEPSPGLLVGMGLIGLAGVRRRRSGQR